MEAQEPIVGKDIIFVDESAQLDERILILKYEESYLYVQTSDGFGVVDTDPYSFVKNVTSNGLTSTLANLLIPLDEGDIPWNALETNTEYRPNDIQYLITT